MTTEQITAINNAMTMLSNISFEEGRFNSIEEFEEYKDTHIKALRASGIDNSIIDHFEGLCNSWKPVVRQFVAELMRLE